jgi:hypothetical protein
LNKRRTLIKSMLAAGTAGVVAPRALATSRAVPAPPRGDREAGDAAAPTASARSFPPTFNPMAGNPLKTRSDVTAAIRALYMPLVSNYSPGGARVTLDRAGARHDEAAAGMEGFARPLWGLAPLAAGGGADFVDWNLLRRGLANGCDPRHPEYWGEPSNMSQRLVEMAGIGFALAIIPSILWQPQTVVAKSNISKYLQRAFKAEEVDTNWLFFRLMMGLGLTAIGEKADPVLIAQYEKKIDMHFLGDGWYRDGKTRRMDYYITFAFHFYGLLNSKLGGDPQRSELYQQRSTAITADFVRWFADDGAALAFGRSLTYRFACGAFWSALAFADVPALPWGQIKGLVLRHLRWWSGQPIAHRDGVLSVGYAYPNLLMSEPYNSAASPYWSFKIFAFMALPESHPFWQAEEQAMPQFEGTSTQVQPGMLVFNPPGDVIALSSGQEELGDWCRGAPEKYCKFAYSARYGFGIDIDATQFLHASFDNMLAFSTDGRHFRIRERNQIVKIAPNMIYAQWQPEEGITVETWLLAAAPWHVRIHRIESLRPYRVIEGGFAVADRARSHSPVAGRAAGVVHTDTDFSAILDLGSSVPRQGRALNAAPNTNLVAARSIVPQLSAEIAAGKTIFIAAVLALADPSAGLAAWATPPAAPDIANLATIIERSGLVVGAMRQ